MEISSDPCSEFYDPCFARDVELSANRSIPSSERNAAEKRIWSRVRQNGQPTSFGATLTWSEEQPYEAQIKARRQNSSVDLRRESIDKKVAVEQKAQQLAIGITP
jgi:hypothetical protein